MKFLALLMLAQTPPADDAVHYKVLMGARVAGKAYVKWRDDAGGKRFIMTLLLTSNKGNVRVRTESFYDKEGTPKERKIETELPNGKKDVTTVTFELGLAKVVQLINDKPSEKTLKIDPTFTVKDPSIFWCRPEVPKPGTSQSLFTLDVGQMKWVSMTVSYEGEKEIRIGGKKLSAHLIEARRGERVGRSFYGQDGSMLAFEDESMRIEKVLE